MTTLGELGIQTAGQFRQYAIRQDMLEALEAYVIKGQLPGGFLQAVICNNLVEACGRADYQNLANIPAYAAWLYNDAPSACWGSHEKMHAWVTRFTKENAK